MPDTQNALLVKIEQALALHKLYRTEAPEDGLLREVEAGLLKLKSAVEQTWPPTPELKALAKSTALIGLRDFPTEWMSLSGMLNLIAKGIQNAGRH
jgi:hypothetical protein